MRRRFSVRLRSDNPAGKGHFTILVVAPNPSSPASRGRITVYVPILCCVGRADPSRPHGLFSVTCIFFSTQRLTIQTGKLRDRTSWGTGGYPDEADTDRGHGRAHGHAYDVALCRKPRIGGRSSRARAGACLLPGRHGLRLGRGYIGINGGYAVGQSEWGSDPRNPSGLSTGNFNVSGGLVGATIGVSGQWGARVFGVEGDFDWQGISGSSSSAFCTSILFPPLLDRPPPD